MTATRVNVEKVGFLNVWGIQDLIRLETSKTRFHRLEVEHALRLANQSHAQTQAILMRGFQATVDELREVSQSIQHLEIGLSEISSSINKFSSVVYEGLSNIAEATHQLHLDNI